MSSTTGYAILGAGIFATTAYLPALSELDGAITLKAVYSRSKSSAEAFAASPLIKSSPTIYHDGQGGIDALLARPDISAVLIVLPIPLQPSIILKSLAAGKHVLSEKPIAKDVATAVSMIKEYQATYAGKGLVWRIAENFEAEPGYRRVADLIREGRLGDVTSFRASVWHYVGKDSEYYKTPWRTVPEYQGGFLLDGGVHTIAAIRTMVPSSPITHLSSFSTLRKDYLLPRDTITVIARGLSFHGTLDMTFGFPTKSHPSDAGFILSGTKGWVSVKTTDGIIKTVLHSLVKEEEYEETEEVFEDKVEGVKVELQSFFGVVNGKNDGKNLGDPKRALFDVAFIEAALNSDGSLVDLEQTGSTVR